MNYQNILCIGDSQTFGARTYGCYPMHLASVLRHDGICYWRAVNWSSNGSKCRDVWFMLSERLGQIHDIYQACLLIGTNDVGENSDVEIFSEYYRQCLLTLWIHGLKAVYCGEIPPIFPKSHAFFDQDSVRRRNLFNAVIKDIITEVPIARLVNFDRLTNDHYVDPVHFNEEGNRIVAECFAQAIRER